MKTRKITLVSHYNKITLNLRINANCAQMLENMDDAIVGINNDIDRYRYGMDLVYLSESQAKKVSNYFKGSIEYFDKVEF